MRFVTNVLIGLIVAITLVNVTAVTLPVVTGVADLWIAPAYAADGTVVVPWGDWISSSLTVANSIPIASLVFGWIGIVAVKLGLPTYLVNLLRTSLTEQLLQRGIDYALNTVAGAAKDKKLEVKVANPVLETAAEYAISNGMAVLVRWLGGEDGIKQKIIARLNLSPDAQVASGMQIISAPPAA